MKWKNKLKTVLSETTENEKNEIYLKKELTKTDETQMNVVSSVFVSDELRHFPKKKSNLPKCSNCDLKMKLIENNTLWFCPMGCESKKAKKE